MVSGIGQISISSVTATQSSPVLSQEGMAFFTMMALSSKGNEKVSTLEKMAMMSMLMQQQKKMEITNINMLPTGFGSSYFTFGGSSGYTAQATPSTTTPITGISVDIQA